MNNIKVAILLIIIFVLAVSGIFYFYQRQTTVDDNLIILPTPITLATPTPTTPTPTVIANNNIATQPTTGASDTEIKNIGIVVESPSGGLQINSPLTVTGRANVYEGHIVIRVLDGIGNILGQTTATACMGEDACPFIAQVNFNKSQTEAGTLEAYSPSSLDGSPKYLQTTLVHF